MLNSFSPTNNTIGLIHRVLSTLYGDQSVKVTLVDGNQLFVEVDDIGRVLALSETDTFEEVFQNLVHWIELCFSYSGSRNPELLRLLQKAGAAYSI